MHKTWIMKISILFFLCFFLTPLREIEFKEYKYSNEYSGLSFSFEMPENWEMNREMDGTGYFLNCTSANKTSNIEKCYMGVFFKIKYISGPLDSALAQTGVVKKTSNIFETWLKKADDGKIKIIVPIAQEKENFASVHFTYEEEYKCDQSKKKKKTGFTQFLYFSNKKETVCIQTDGNKLDEEVLKRIMGTFRFG